MTFEHAQKLLKESKAPEEVFLGVVNTAGLTKEFRRLVQAVHPDRNPGNIAEAADAFQKLVAWEDRARKKLDAGTWGDLKPHILATLTTKTATYELTSLRTDQGKGAVVYGGTCGGAPVLVRFPNSEKDNDLMRNEASAYAVLAKDPGSRSPVLLDSFVADGKQVNVIREVPGFVSIRQVLHRYPDGLELGDAAWMFNRMVEALILASRAGIVHGAINPDTMWVHPETHQGGLSDWQYSVKTGGKVSAIYPGMRAATAPEILRKEPVDVRTDVWAAAAVMQVLLSRQTRYREVLGMLRRATSASTGLRHTGDELHIRFNDLLKQILGPKKFREFKWEPATA